MGTNPPHFLIEKVGRKWPYSDFPIGRIQLKVPGNPAAASKIALFQNKNRCRVARLDILDPNLANLDIFQAAWIQKIIFGYFGYFSPKSLENRILLSNHL